MCFKITNKLQCNAMMHNACTRRHSLDFNHVSKNIKELFSDK